MNELDDATPPDVSCVWVAGKLRVQTTSESKAEVLATLVCAIGEVDPRFGSLIQAVAVVRSVGGARRSAEPQS